MSRRCDVDITKMRGVLYAIFLLYEPFLCKRFGKMISSRASQWVWHFKPFRAREEVALQFPVL